MDNASLLWVLAGMQSVTIFLVGWVRYDQKKSEDATRKMVDDLWKRADNHGHGIKCTEDHCRLRTCGVIVHEQRGDL